MKKTLVLLIFVWVVKTVCGNEGLSTLLNDPSKQTIKAMLPFGSQGECTKVIYWEL